MGRVENSLAVGHLHVVRQQSPHEVPTEHIPVADKCRRDNREYTQVVIDERLARVADTLAERLDADRLLALLKRGVLNFATLGDLLHAVDDTGRVKTACTEIVHAGLTGDFVPKLRRELILRPQHLVDHALEQQREIAGAVRTAEKRLGHLGTVHASGANAALGQQFTADLYHGHATELAGAGIQ